jgi:DNA primase
MASIPEEIVDRVRAEANIVDVVSDYVRLRRTGKNWVGLCPFHDDQKPSFAVEPVKGIYRCFACGKGGNVFTFLMELNGWSFPEAVRSLAASLNIEIPENRREQEGLSENERLASAVKEAAAFFQQVLKSDAGLPGQAYFKKRGFTSETLARFGLGYAPDAWEELFTRLTKLGYTPQELERAGLAIKREGRSGWYDRFRGRTIFPIYTATGRVVGFGARRMSEDPNQPKYINSPESPIYQKSRLLYGLYQAKDAIRKNGLALFVEGYADVISLHQAGIQTAIATCGTALATEHAELVARYTSRVILVFDSDAAGQSATERGIDVLLRKGLDVAVLRLPDGEDPDTFVRKFGAREVERRISESISFLEFRARAMKLAGDFDSPDRATEAIRTIVSSISLIPDALKRELYVQKLAADYHISETLMADELERALGKQGQVRRRALPRPEGGPRMPSQGEEQGVPAQAGPAVEPAPALRKPVTRAELPSAEIGLLGVLVQGDPQMLEHVFDRINPDDFSHPLTRELVALILDHYVNQRSFSIDQLISENLRPELRDLAAMLAIERETISPWWNKVDPELPEPNQWRIARDCLIQIEQARIEREYRSIQDRLRNGDLSGEEVTDILEKIRELQIRKAELAALLAS